MDLSGYDRSEGMYESCEMNIEQPETPAEPPQQVQELQKDKVEDDLNSKPVILSKEELIKPQDSETPKKTEISTFCNLAIDDVYIYIALVVLVIAVYFYTK
jgi:hypothetical protein